MKADREEMCFNWDPLIYLGRESPLTGQQGGFSNTRGDQSIRPHMCLASPAEDR